MAMATWGPKILIVSPSMVAALEGLTTSLTLKQDSENDTSGTQPTNTRGRELRPISFNVTYLSVAGANPRQEIAEWEAELGNAYPLIVGDERFGAEKMKLTRVDTSDILLSHTGSFIKATVGITLEEYSEGKTSKLISTTSAGSSAASKAAATYAATVAAKKAALSATASASDRALKKATTGAEVSMQ